jgi:hypothetical protein
MGNFNFVSGTGKTGDINISNTYLANADESKKSNKESMYRKDGKNDRESGKFSDISND